jgi:hypothetical protein
MPLDITAEDVLAVIDVRRAPLCSEQIAHALELKLRVGPGRVTLSKLAVPVRTLVDEGRIVLLTNRDQVRELGAFPQHFGPRTKFYLGVSIAQERLGPDALPVAASSARTPNTPRKTSARRSSPVITTRRIPPMPSCSDTPMSDTAISNPRSSRRACPQRPDVDFSTVPSMSFLTAEADVTADPFGPQFSSAATPALPQRPIEETLAETAQRLAAILTEGARTLHQKTNALILPLNLAWQQGEFTDQKHAAAQLSHLYDLATDSAATLTAAAEQLRSASADPSA